MSRLRASVWVVLVCLAGCAGPGTEPPASTDVAPPAAPPAGAPLGVTGELPGSDSPEAAVRAFVDAESAGDEAAARRQIWPDSSPYRLEAAKPLRAYRLVAERRLDAAEAAEFTATPQREAGDAVVDVWVEYPDGRTSELTYFLREYDGRWRIYSLSFNM